MKRLIKMYQDMRLFVIVTMVACCAVALMDIFANGSTWFNWVGFALGIGFLIFLSTHYPRNPRALMWLAEGDKDKDDDL